MAVLYKSPGSYAFPLMLVGTIPGGGMFGELLILTIYGFPPSVLIAISLIIDPIATLLNVTGNTARSMVITRLASGKNWWQVPPCP